MKLHLGCGPRHIPGYYHVDIGDFPHVDLRHGIDRIPMMADSSADVIYVCHALEHFHRRETQRVLREWLRILRPGGTLRVAVPDFEAICEVYAQRRNLDLVIGPLFGRQDYLWNVHYTVFDFRALERDLAAVGFTRVRRYDWRHTDHASVDDYSRSYIPHMDFAHGKLISLNVEADKPE